MSIPVFRFAPSPNGYLHLGHAYSALFTWSAAERAGGTVLLRIEDIDTTRSRPEYVAQIFDDLFFLGLEWPEPVRVQSEHFGDYHKALDVLVAKKLVYRCFCSRGDIKRAAGSSAKCDPDGGLIYPGTCKSLTEEQKERLTNEGKPFALRLDMQAALERVDETLFFNEIGQGEVEAQPQKWGDVVVARKDIGTSYHIAVVVDDALQGVTNVTRGRDLYEATHIHRLLQHHLDLPAPAYQHHELIGDETGRKLSKRFADKSLKAMREEGVSAKEIRALLGFS